MSARSGCSRATSRPPGGRSATGQLLPISENETLFQLIGTTYGGDGESTFALPDLRGRLPLHQGNGFILAETGGAEEVTLTVNQIPAHTHPLLARPRSAPPPARRAAVLAASGSSNVYQHRAGRGVPWLQPAVGPVGGSQPHTNLQPYLCIDFIISLFGIFPVPDLGADMTDQFVAEIRIFPFNFAPKGWAICDGQLLPISQNTALFSLLGTTYGGDGKSTFALPDLQGRAPMHRARVRACPIAFLGEAGRHPRRVTLLAERDPVPHPRRERQPAARPTCQAPALRPRPRPRQQQRLPRQPGQPGRHGAARRSAPAGGGQPHNNMQPYLTLNFCIALQGIFPPRP